MSASLRFAKPSGVRRPVPGPGRSTPPTQRSTAHHRQAELNLDGIGGHAEQQAPAEVPQRPSRRPATSGQRSAAHNRQTGLNLDGVDGHAEQEALAVSPGRPGRVVLSGPRPRPEARPGARFGRRRGVVGLVAVCVLALGMAACSARDAKAEASASASASASAAIARAEKGIADANASATASWEAALTPELRAKRDAALAEPAPAKPPQLKEESAEGAAASVGYFLNLYRYAFMTGNTTELAKISEDRCKFCQSAINRATSLHTTGGWIDKWEQNVANVTYYEKLEGRDYNRVAVVVDYGTMTSHPGDGGSAKTSAPDKGRSLNFGVRYVDGGWLVGGVEVAK